MAGGITSNSHTTGNIVGKLWNLCNVLKDDGVTYHQYVSELTYLLFLKMAQETGQEQGIPPHYRWAVLECLEGDSQLDHYKELLLRLGRPPREEEEKTDSEAPIAAIVQEIFANASTFIKKPVTLSKLVSEIDKLIRARCDPGKVLPAYVEIAFGSDSVRSQVESLAKSSAGQKGISGGDLKVIRFSLPLIEEQQKIVRSAQELFTLADQLEARLQNARKVVDRLTPALLAKAFRGELVPQDPGDEPASELLARIRAARQAGAGAAKPSRRGRPKAAANPEQLNLNSAPAPSDSPPPDLLACLLRECGPLSERALLAASELRPETFRVQLAREQELGAVRDSREDDQVLLEAVG